MKITVTDPRKDTFQGKTYTSYLVTTTLDDDFFQVRRRFLEHIFSVLFFDMKMKSDTRNFKKYTMKLLNC